MFNIPEADYLNRIHNVTEDPVIQPARVAMGVDTGPRPKARENHAVVYVALTLASSRGAPENVALSTEDSDWTEQ
jgi:hypothetical protein